VIAESHEVVLATPAPNSMVPELMVIVLDANTAPTEATSATPLMIRNFLLLLLLVSFEVILLPLLFWAKRTAYHLTLSDKQVNKYLPKVNEYFSESGTKVIKRVFT
jgi:hypothetical protein